MECVRICVNNPTDMSCIRVAYASGYDYEYKNHTNGIFQPYIREKPYDFEIRQFSIKIKSIHSITQCWSFKKYIFYYYFFLAIVCSDVSSTRAPGPRRSPAGWSPTRPAGPQPPHRGWEEDHPGRHGPTEKGRWEGTVDAKVSHYDSLSFKRVRERVKKERVIVGTSRANCHVSCARAVSAELG